MNPDLREENLPKWARDELLRLRATIREQEEQIAILGSAPGLAEDCGGFYVNRFTQGPVPIPSGRNGIIVRLGSRDELQLRISPAAGLPMLEVANMGSSGLVIRPWVTNVALLGPGER